MAPEVTNVLIAGLGGQGVLKASDILADAAFRSGRDVKKAEVHGMSQRGGSVTSHLKIGGNGSPLIRRGTADLLLALESNEAIRNLPFLRRGGVAIINTEQDLPSEIARHLVWLNIQVLSVPATQMAVELGSARVSNVIVVGFAAAHPSLTLSIDALKETLTVVTRRRHELNLRALEAGYHAGERRLPLVAPRELTRSEQFGSRQMPTVYTDSLQQSTEEAG